MHDETCPRCHGPALPLGTLGALTHYRCRNCGWTFADPAETMAAFSAREERARRNTRPAQPGNNRAAVRETVRLVEAGRLVVDRDLVL